MCYHIHQKNNPITEIMLSIQEIMFPTPETIANLLKPPTSNEMIQMFPHFKEQLIEADRKTKLAKEKYENALHALDPLKFKSRRNIIGGAFYRAGFAFDKILYGIDCDEKLMKMMKTFAQLMLCTHFHPNAEGKCKTCKRLYENHFDKPDDDILTLILTIGKVLPYIAEMHDEYKTNFAKIEQLSEEDKCFIEIKKNLIVKLRNLGCAKYTSLIECIVSCKTHSEIVEDVKQCIEFLMCPDEGYVFTAYNDLAIELVVLFPELQKFYLGFCANVRFAFDSSDGETEEESEESEESEEIEEESESRIKKKNREEAFEGEFEEESERRVKRKTE